MKRVFLYAYDKQNLGDDLFIHTITKRYPKTKFYLWSDKQNKHNFKRIKNLTVVAQDGAFVRFLKKIRPSLAVRYKNRYIRRAVASVYIGGSIFMEYKHWETIVGWWEYAVNAYPMYALGCNFGPYQTEEYRKSMQEIFSKMQDVCFRDTYSKKLFQTLDKVRCAPDILFGCPMPSLPIDEKRIFVSVIDCASRDEGDTSSLSQYDESYIHNVTKLLKEYLSNGYTLTLASFCKTEGDEKAVQKIREGLQVSLEDNRVNNLFYDGTNVEELLASIASAKYVIASRFHGAILGLSAGRPVLPIVYGDKTLRVLEDISFTGKVLDIRKKESVSFAEAQKNFANFQLPNVSELANDAETHFINLDKVIGT